MHTTKKRQRICGGVFAIAIHFTVGAAQGQTVDQARRLYEDAKRAYEAEKYDIACPKFEQVLQLKPSHLRSGISLAKCYLKLGRTGDAWNWLNITRGRAINADDIEKTEEIDQFKKDLENSLARLRIHVPVCYRALPNWTVLRNGLVVRESDWNEAIPVNPGLHTIMMSASGAHEWEKDFDVAAGKTVDVHPPPGWCEDADKKLQNERWALRFAALGLGVAGIGFVVGAFGAQDRADSKHEASLKGHCDTNNLCDATGRNLQAQELTNQNLAATFGVLGGVSMLGSIVLVYRSFTLPSKTNTSTPQAVVWIGPQSIGIRGNF